jgi:hypothetical protein
MALPQNTLQKPSGQTCTYSTIETASLSAGHDINTGMHKVGSTVSQVSPGFPSVGGGCSPAWAIGGKPEDDTPMKTSPT